MPMLPPLLLPDRIAAVDADRVRRFRLTSAPPELPGLIDASVWMKSS
jgi:hypothetical protein